MFLLFRPSAIVPWAFPLIWERLRLVKEWAKAVLLKACEGQSTFTTASHLPSQNSRIFMQEDNMICKSADLTSWPFKAAIRGFQSPFWSRGLGMTGRPWPWPTAQTLAPSKELKQFIEYCCQTPPHPYKVITFPSAFLWHKGSLSARGWSSSRTGN